MPTASRRAIPFRDAEFTSEAVSEGHPDKVADRLSDEVLDAALRQNPKARVAVETLVTTDRVVLAGEVSGLDGLPIPELVREAVRDIGYADPGFDHRSVAIEVLIHEQSREIARAVGDAGEGAGDQGLMFGYATCETPELMPLPLVLAHRLLGWLTAQRKAGELALRPDAKSQVTVRYVDGRPVGVERIVISHQHREGAGDRVQELAREAMRACIPGEWLDSTPALLVNPSGSFVLGGPCADTGLTGRKIIVDTYGGAAPHGGGAFSGKDPTKVDRSAAYAARWLARNVVAAGMAERCLVQVAYAIGVAEPVSVAVETSGTGGLPDSEIARRLRRCVDLRPAAIRARLGLERPIYVPTSTGGHFGRTPGADGSFSWERDDLVEALKAG